MKTAHQYAHNQWDRGHKEYNRVQPKRPNDPTGPAQHSVAPSSVFAKQWPLWALAAYQASRPTLPTPFAPQPPRRNSYRPSARPGYRYLQANHLAGTSTCRKQPVPRGHTPCATSRASLRTWKCTRLLTSPQSGDKQAQLCRASGNI